MSNVKKVEIEVTVNHEILQDNEWLMMIMGRLLTNPWLGLKAEIKDVGSPNVYIMITGEEAIPWNLLIKMSKAFLKCQVLGTYFLVRAKDVEDGGGWVSL